MTSSSEVYQLLAVCQYCQNMDVNGGYNLQKINNWEFSFGFTYPFELPSSFNGKIDGRPFHFAVQFDPTTIWISGVEAATNMHGMVTCVDMYAGPLFEDYMMLSKMMNFKLEIYKNMDSSCGENSPINNDWRKVTQSSTPSEDIKNLVSYTVQAVGGTNLASYEVFQIVDISAPTFYQSGANIVSVEPLTTFQWYAIFQPFTWYVWLLIIGMIPLCGGILHLLRKYSRASDKKPGLWNATWDIATIMCWESVKVPKPSVGIAVLLGSYLLATHVLITEYLGEITSYMVNPSYERPPIESTEQIFEAKMMWIGGRMTDYYVNYFSYLEGVEDQLRLLRPTEMKHEEKSAIEMMIRNPDRYVYFEKAGLVEWNICKYGIDLDNRKMYYSKETVGDYNTHMYFQKKAPYTETFNRKILLLQDTGIIKMNQRRFFQNTTKSSCYEKKQYDMALITLVHISSGFLVMGFGFLMVILAFVYELIARLKENLNISWN